MATKGLGTRQSEEAKAARALGLPPKKKIKEQTDVLGAAGITPIPLKGVSSIGKAVKPRRSIKSKAARFVTRTINPFKGPTAGQLADSTKKKKK